MQPQYIPQQQGVTVVAQNAPAANDDKFSASARSQMRVLSIIQVVMGALCIVFGIALIVIEAAGSTKYYGSAFAHGIWIGAYFVLVGAIGLGAVQSNTECFIISAMVLNIICSAVFWHTLLTFCAVSLGLVTTYGYCDYDYYYYSFYISPDCSGYSGSAKAVLALNSLMLIMSLAELVITIWCAALCCGAVCRCCKTTTTGHVIQYSPAQLYAQPQTVAYPAGSTTVYTTTQAYPAQAAYPAAVHQVPVGYTAQPQAPPSYQPVSQGSSNYQQPSLPQQQPSKQ